MKPDTRVGVACGAVALAVIILLLGDPGPNKTILAVSS